MYIFYELCLFLYLHTRIILVFYIYNAYVDGVGGFSTDVSILSLSITGFDYALGSPPLPAQHSQRIDKLLIVEKGKKR